MSLHLTLSQNIRRLITTLRLATLMELNLYSRLISIQIKKFIAITNTI
jgi:hypothetical protein